MENILVSENDLVLVRLNNDPEKKGKRYHYNVWLRVLFIDLDNSFHGKVERKDVNYKLDDVGDIIQLNLNDTLSVFDENDGMQWCYSDDVTRCDCNGLCKNK